MNKTKAIVFFGIVLIGLIISIFTLNKLGKPIELPPKHGNGEKVEKANVAPAPRQEKVTQSTEEKNSEKKKPIPGKPTPAGSGSPASNSSPEAVMAALSKTIAAKDYPGFLAAVGEKAVPRSIRPRLKSTIENPALTVDSGKPVSEISKSVKSLRWAINLVPKTGHPGAVQIYTDIIESAPHLFEVVKVGFPLELEKPGSPAAAKGPPNSKMSAQPAAGNPDALTVAHAFSKAVVAKDFEGARSLADPATVTDERLAALLIAVEEGNFSLKKDRPLVETLARKDIAWVLTRVESARQSSEFALELGRVGPDWKVNGLTFSKVIASLADSAGAGDVVYAPFVEHPEGGDSLVLYFGFDQSNVTPRTSRQLSIVAKILKADRSRKIVISGHADALGPDDYNSRLSDERAVAIRRTLIDEGANPSQIVTKAFGETEPISPNYNPDGSDNPKGRSHNRRAEVYLNF